LESKFARTHLEYPNCIIQKLTEVDVPSSAAIASSSNVLIHSHGWNFTIYDELRCFTSLTLVMVLTKQVRVVSIILLRQYRWHFWWL